MSNFQAKNPKKQDQNLKKISESWVFASSLIDRVLWSEKKWPLIMCASLDFLTFHRPWKKHTGENAKCGHAKIAENRGRFFYLSSKSLSKSLKKKTLYISERTRIITNLCYGKYQIKAMGKFWYFFEKNSKMSRLR